MIFTTLVLLFLLRIRYPKGKSISQIILHRYNYSALQAFRNFEKTDLKLKKTDKHIEFLETCLHYEVFPKFVQFKVTSNKFKKTAHYKRCQIEILKHELRSQERIRQDIELNMNIVSRYFKLTCLGWILVALD